MTTISHCLTAAHRHLIDEAQVLHDVLNVKRDRDIQTLLRTAMADVEVTASRALTTFDPRHARRIWNLCAHAESAIYTAAHEACRRDRITVADRDRIRGVVTNARRFRDQVVRTLDDGAGASPQL
jgi:hypothetical protein